MANNIKRRIKYFEHNRSIKKLAEAIWKYGLRRRYCDNMSLEESKECAQDIAIGILWNDADLVADAMIHFCSICSIIITNSVPNKRVNKSAYRRFNSSLQKLSKAIWKYSLKPSIDPVYQKTDSWILAISILQLSLDGPRDVLSYVSNGTRIFPRRK